MSLAIVSSIVCFLAFLFSQSSIVNTLHNITAIIPWFWVVVPLEF